eukprot:CAMPEP_0198618446 /NCGR_PEP_ID=MMETSP1462-20131121/160896_1 /TAXON_ID=1333877 /ORGANISM="Brandtodinium nutriculum, Strain RCC3387" /LENGTH=610 /DNA_ID=CAMNT_0044350245 /DNA_START=26 /DNA_END=1855 /DNA_ORIENTATION=+
MMLLNFDIEVLKVSCLLNMSPAWSYLVKLSTIFWVLLAVLVVHALHFRLGPLSARMPALFGVVGAIFFAFLTSMVVMAIAPLQCQHHPNGETTVQRYPTVVCAGRAEHARMLGIGMAFLTIPSTFVAFCCVVVSQFPARMHRGDWAFVSTFAFLFLRFKPDAYWYGLFLLLRNMGIALSAAVPNAFAQVSAPMLLFLVSIVLTILVRPWRNPVANAMDTIVSFCMAILLQCGSYMLDSRDDRTVGTLTSVVVMAMTLSLTGGLFFAGTAHMLRGLRKDFKYFISHHKAGTGAMARLLKVYLTDATHQGVFIDTDNLSNLEVLFDIVGVQTETVVTLLSSEFWLRPWCIGEIVAAHLKKVAVSSIHCPGYQEPTEGFRKQLPHLVDLSVLSSRGLSLGAVAAAMDWVCKDCPSLLLPRTLTAGSLAEITAYLQRGSPRNTILQADPSADGTVGAKSSVRTEASGALEQASKVVVIVDHANCQATWTALVICKLVGKRLLDDLSLMPHLAPEGAALSPRAHSCIVVFSVGAIGQVDFLQALSEADDRRFAVLPVISEEAFQIPDRKQVEVVAGPALRELEELGVGCGSNGIFRIVSGIFLEIAVRFAPQDAG